MSSKRALVVDDSKSARAFLSRILERHEITVDAAESAEAAIEYLARNKPDVIFMDHMMPGMDGFQAVQTIKNNPRTSTIPILMYTSQEGDLYLGQARALGAEGVLPKQIKQTDVTRMLYQLRLVADRRGEEQTALTRMAPSPQLLPANESAIVVTPPADVVQSIAAVEAANTAGGAEIAQLMPQMALEIRTSLHQALQAELGALKGFISTSLESHTERLHGDLAALQPAPRPPEAGLPPMLPERRNWAAILGWSSCVLALSGAGLAGWLWWQQGAEVAALRTDLAAAYAEVETLRARPVLVSPPPVAAEPAVDPGAVTPAGDAPDAAAATAADVVLVPAGTSVDSALQAASVAPAATPEVATPATVAPPIATQPGAAPAQ
jgi:CheY-like chemotaxis protein